MPYRAKSSETDVIFGALANPTRREILDLLRSGPRAVQDIAVHFDMTRPSVSEHLKVLLDAGLVTEQRDGRRRVYEVRADPLSHLADWLTPYERHWRERLAGLRDVLEEEQA
ncbi:MAG TPA: metalloregulator ArsR/SmtB family transcription factor [Trebonia sp.]|jgi:DNA-binding transcriptional ArsR family regulator|nr:metalloregulator ArsR/SmtB family transcription factor [Trebonia sp.]